MTNSVIELIRVKKWSKGTDSYSTIHISELSDKNELLRLALKLDTAQPSRMSHSDQGSLRSGAYVSRVCLITLGV